MSNIRVAYLQVSAGAKNNNIPISAQDLLAILLPNIILERVL